MGVKRHGDLGCGMASSGAAVLAAGAVGVAVAGAA